MIPIFDGHNDTLTQLYNVEGKNKRSFFEESDIGHIDLPRAIKSGFKGGLFSIFVPPFDSKERNPLYGVKMDKKGFTVKMKSEIPQSYARDYTNSLIDFLSDLITSSNGRLNILYEVNDVKNSIRNNIIGVTIHFEGAEAINRDLKNLTQYYEKGLRSLGIVWSRKNSFGIGVPFQFPHSPDIGPGLTELGKKLVLRCNELGIIIDLAHINEKGFWDVAKLSKFPLVVSHTAVHRLCKSTRNLTDNQIDVIADTDGVIGVFFEPTNIKYTGNPQEKINLEDIIDHLDYIANRVGVNHVAFGSDFDGTSMKSGMKDVTDFPKLIEILEKRGYTRNSIEKIAYKNWLRIIKATWN